jgi:hypothetical protein
MRPTTKRVVAMLGLMVMAGAPAVASAGNGKGGPRPSEGTARFYALTENMKVRPQNRPGQGAQSRVATGALTGVATVGNPFCPAPELQSGPSGCAVNVLGRDSVSLATGLGTLDGTYATVIQGDNPFDGPEAVVVSGRFRGEMDFSPAILGQIPYGTVSGTVTGERGYQASFTGMLRLPFAGNVEVGPGLTLRQLLCPATPDPNQYTDSLYGGFDLAYLDNVEAAMTPAGRCLDIQPHELAPAPARESLVPMVRFDIVF